MSNCASCDRPIDPIPMGLLITSGAVDITSFELLKEDFDNRPIEYFWEDVCLKCKNIAKASLGRILTSEPESSFKFEEAAELLGWTEAELFANVYGDDYE